MTALGCTVDRNVCFTTAGACDHYGNVPGVLQPTAPPPDPKTGHRSPRFTHWLPDPQLPLLHAGPVPVSGEVGQLPGWVQQIAEGRKLAGQRPHTTNASPPPPPLGVAAAAAARL